ncbi:hypothetical protein EDB81DRAFT_43092 [Dactylonectria macrodidyma]|uniref:Uncharacterized protein n=1 Tax=Dactylonectria macrodidyma TaxID=307937 RepID=A0A9P9FU72_9HYPO|nr:hypothetical protein EDB81DRAFT_43092 [Dactylonectria macrodidyma]
MNDWRYEKQVGVCRHVLSYADEKEVYLFTSAPGPTGPVLQISGWWLFLPRRHCIYARHTHSAVQLFCHQLLDLARLIGVRHLVAQVRVAFGIHCLAAPGAEVVDDNVVAHCACCFWERGPSLMTMLLGFDVIGGCLAALALHLVAMRTRALKVGKGGDDGCIYRRTTCG